MSRVTRVQDVAIPLAPLPASDVVQGEPAAAAVELTRVGDVAVGVWQMTAGIARDTEADEVFLVLGGRAEIVFVDSDERIEVGVGDLVTLHEGERTEWIVHEAITKVWIA